MEDVIGSATYHILFTAFGVTSTEGGILLSEPYGLFPMLPIGEVKDAFQEKLKFILRQFIHSLVSLFFVVLPDYGGHFIQRFHVYLTLCSRNGRNPGRCTPSD